jgi:serine/threonine protein kinase
MSDEIQMNENEIAFICKNVLNALAFLHSNGIYHKELNSENILTYRNGEIKLSM